MSSISPDRPPGYYKNNPLGEPDPKKEKVVPTANTATFTKTTNAEKAEADRKSQTVAKKSLEEFKEELAAPRKSLGARFWNWIKENIILAIARLFGYQKKEKIEDAIFNDITILPTAPVEATEKPETPAPETPAPKKPVPKPKESIDILKEQLDELVENNADPEEWNKLIDNLFAEERNEQIKTVSAKIKNDEDIINTQTAMIATSNAKILTDEAQIKTDQKKIRTEEAAIIADVSKVVPEDQQKAKDEAIASRRKQLENDRKKLRADLVSFRKLKAGVTKQNQDLVRRNVNLISDKRKFENDQVKIQNAGSSDQPIQFEALNFKIVDFEAFKVKVRYELMNVIENNPENIEAFDPLFARIGVAPGIIAPAGLVNKGVSCFVDSLLQLLFASKSFISYLKSGDRLPDNPIVIALRNYCRGLEAGMGSTDGINDLRNAVMEAMAAIPGIEDKLPDGIDSQQEITVLLDIIYEELSLAKVEEGEQIVIKPKKTGLMGIITTTYANAFTKDDTAEFHLPSLNPLTVPGILPLSDEQKLLAQESQVAEDEAHRIDTEKRLNARLPPIDKRNIINEWTATHNQITVVDLQKVIDDSFLQKSEVSDVAINSALEYANSLPEGSEYRGVKREEGAKNYSTENRLNGVAPSVLFIPLQRKYTVRNPNTNLAEERTNNRKIVLPADEIVTMPIGGKNVRYKVLGIAGGSPSMGGGHYVANVQVKDKWYFTNDSSKKDEKKHITTPELLTSDNHLGQKKMGSYNMETHGYLYILEKVEEPVPE